MADRDYVEVIPVLRGHLEEINEALIAAFGYVEALDIAEQFRNVGGVVRQSNLQKRLENVSERLKGYLAQEEENDV
jgi:hypothetical protein